MPVGASDAEPEPDATPEAPDAALLALEAYDRTCTVNSDCALGLDPTCENTYPMCASTPIRVVDAERYQREVTDRMNAPGCRQNKGMERAYCPRLQPICAQGRCAAMPQLDSLFSAAPYATGCATNDDCVAVSLERCYCTDCFDGTILKTAQARFDAEFAAAPACGDRGPCPGAHACEDVNAYCIEQRCELIDGRRGE